MKAYSKKNEILYLHTHPAQDQETQSEARIPLARGRTLAVVQEGADQGGNEIVEIRAATGALELRVKLTEDGPVLALEGLRLAVQAAETIEMQCKRFSVEASESIELATGGALAVEATQDATIESHGMLRVRGRMIHLN